MKKTIVLLIAVILCLSLAACGSAPGSEQVPQNPNTEASDTEGSEEMQQPQSDSSAQSGSTTEKSEETTHQSMDLTGPWHLDSEKNDHTALSNRFPGYAEWGASMEIRSDGQMSWYIGAEGWHGTYEVDGETLHAEMNSELDGRTLSWDFHITTENGSAMLETEYEDITLCWIYGEAEEASN